MSKKSESNKDKQSFLKEFKEFILRGNVIELAVGLTVGAAFTEVINSLVNNLVMPVIGLVTRGDSFKNRFVALDGTEYDSLEIAQAANAPILAYGQVITDLLNFLIIGLVIFITIKGINKLRKENVS